MNLFTKRYRAYNLLIFKDDKEGVSWSYLIMRRLPLSCDQKTTFSSTVFAEECVFYNKLQYVNRMIYCLFYTYFIKSDLLWRKNDFGWE